MNKNETAKILAILNACYQAKGDAKTMVNAWHAVLADYEYDITEQAAMNFIATDKRDYPGFPVPGQIRAQIELLLPEGDTPEELWNRVYKAICNSGYRAGDEFEKLPECCRKWLGSANTLRELGMTDTGTVNTVVRGQFLKTIGAVRERQEAQRKLPESIRKTLIAGLQEGGLA